MPLPLTVSCFSGIQIGFIFLVPAHLGIPGKRAVKRVCVCVCVCVRACVRACVHACMHACVHVITVLCRYYEDFKITSGTSNLTKIYVEASITCNICPCFLTILCICSQHVLSVSLIGFVFKISLQLFLHFIHLCLYVPSFNVTMFLWSLWCYVIQVWL